MVNLPHVCRVKGSSLSKKRVGEKYIAPKCMTRDSSVPMRRNLLESGLSLNRD